MPEKPQAGDYIEIWSCESANLLAYGDVIEMTDANTVVFDNKWLDGSTRVSYMKIEPGSLCENTDGSGWFACIDPQRFV